MADIKKTKTKTNIGISITHDFIEAAIFSEKGFKIENSVTMPVPAGLFSGEGEEVTDPGLLSQVFKDLMAELRPKTRSFHLSVPPTLVRVLELPQIDKKQLYLSLSSEAERYRAFDDAEAVVDYVDLEGVPVPRGMQRILFLAMRRDTYDAYQKAAQLSKLKIASIDVEPFNILRGMAGTGVLESLVQQMGADKPWGFLYVGMNRVMISLWKGNNLLELREVNIDTHALLQAGPSSPYVTDLVDEIRRTASMHDPGIWLTHNLGGDLVQGLNEQLQLPVRPCLWGPHLQSDNPNLMVSTIGTCRHSSVLFPFDLNMQAGAKASSKGGDDAADDTGGVDPKPILIGGIVTCILLTGIWVVLSGLNGLWLSGAIAQLTKDKEQKEAEQVSLNAQKEAQKKKSDIQSSIITAINNVVLRNQLYVHLVDDLKKTTPQDLWLTSMDVNDSISIKGKALSSQAIIHFAKGFDAIPYTTNIAVRSIKESSAPAHSFEFEVGGQIKLDEDALLPEDWKEKPAKADASKISLPKLPLPKQPGDKS